jgi:hypothetical protein
MMRLVKAAWFQIFFASECDEAIAIGEEWVTWLSQWRGLAIDCAL